METVKAFPAGYNEKGESLHLPGGLRCTTLAPESLIQKNSGRKHILKGNLRTFSDSGTTVYILRRHKDALFAWAEALDEGRIKKDASLFHFDDRLDGIKPSKKLKSTAELSDIASFIESSRSDQYIHPAYKLGIIGQVHWFANHNSEQSAAFPLNQMAKSQIELTAFIDDYSKKGRIVDIDMNYFSRLWYFIRPNNYEYYLFRNLIQKAGVVTISTNPEQPHVANELQTAKILIGRSFQSQDLAKARFRGSYGSIYKLQMRDLINAQFIDTLANIEKLEKRFRSRFIVRALASGQPIETCIPAN